MLLGYGRIAQSYSDIKGDLAAQHPDGVEAYMDGKDTLIKTIEQCALSWNPDNPN
ncbi:MAG: hypothetical protein RLZZ597_215 [Cyanobacteriota bacterium]|jgi:GrpB-like predicted nucleotidyltransferase (UPF0157 family)